MFTYAFSRSIDKENIFCFKFITPVRLALFLANPTGFNQFVKPHKPYYYAMNRKITYSFRSLSEVSLFIERPNDWSDFAHFHPKSPIERISFAQGMVESQFYDHFLFQMEAISARIHQEVKVDYTLHKECFILLMVLDGVILFQDPSSEDLIELSAGDCIGVYGESLKSICQLPPGNCGLCYIIPKNNWSIDNIHLFPTFNEFWREMRRQYKPFDALPICLINEQMEVAIKKIFFQRWSPKDILKAEPTKDISELFFCFHDVVTRKLMQRS